MDPTETDKILEDIILEVANLIGDDSDELRRTERNEQRAHEEVFAEIGNQIRNMAVVRRGNSEAGKKVSKHEVYLLKNRKMDVNQ